MTVTINLPIRKVSKFDNGSYVVVRLIGGYTWEPVSKEYAHSTSAFAALGRLVQKDTLR